MRYWFFLSLILAGTAHADCPAPPDIGTEEAEILLRIRDAKTERDARLLSNELWGLWATAPDEASQALLDRGMTARAAYDFLSALDAFDRLVDYCPDYAEGYNQRAFVNFLREDFAKALVDLDEAIERRPTHVAAMAGKAMTLMALGRHEEAQTVLRFAVDLNPWLPERGLLREPTDKDL